MKAIDLLDENWTLSCLVEAIESGRENEIVVMRLAHPVAKVVALCGQETPVRLGVAKGFFVVPNNIDLHNGAVMTEFTGQIPRALD